ncbi:MAG: hypothetical protein GX442_01560 [Candidatus Riflebacteria bacterium]|nr:hypothetical protein [Candidatus Riflebacteria bacterium]
MIRGFRTFAGGAVFRLFRLWSENRRREALAQLALALAAGRPLPRALALAISSCDWTPIRQAFAHLSEGLAQGLPLPGLLVHPSCRELPAVFRAILGADLPDREKGMILQTRLLSGPVTAGSSGADGLAYLVTEFAVGLLVVLQLLMFVLPQFKEIFRSLDAPLPPLSRAILWIGDLSSPALLVVLLLAPLAGWFLYRGVGHLIGRTHRSQELAEVLRLLPGISHARLPYLLTVIGHPVIFPQTGAALRQVGECLLQREPLDRALAGLHADPLALLLLRLGLQRGKTPAFLAEGADLLETRVTASRQRFMTAVESLLVLGLGTAVGVIAAGVMMPMIAMLELL